MANGENDKDKKKGSKRVYKSEADKAKQAKMEGKDTPFQNALRAAEKSGKKTFTFNGKLYAATTTAPKPKSPDIKKASPKKPDTSTKSPDLPAPKRVNVKGTEKVLAKDVTGKPLYQRRNKASAKGVTRRLKKRQKRRDY